MTLSASPSRDRDSGAAQPSRRFDCVIFDCDGVLVDSEPIVNRVLNQMLNELGIAYRKKENFKEAANMFRKAISKDGKFAVAHYNLGEAEYRSGNLGEAKKAYQNLKKLGRNDLAVQLELISGGAVRGATE